MKFSRPSMTSSAASLTEPETSLEAFAVCPASTVRNSSAFCASKSFMPLSISRSALKSSGSLEARRVAASCSLRTPRSSL
jgi:hypothetical protein